MSPDALSGRTPRAQAAVPADVVDTLMDEAHRAESAGRRTLARQRYESALYLLRSATDPSARSAAGVKASVILRRIGRTYLDDGLHDVGMDCLAAALASAEAQGDAGAIAHAIHVMAISHLQRGLLHDAEPLCHQAARLAREAGDDRLAAMVAQNLGIMASMRGDDAAALAHHVASLEGYRRLGLRQELARQLNNIGLVHTKLGNPGEAMEAYQEALAIARASGDDWTRLMVEVNNVSLLISQRDFPLARVLNETVLAEVEGLRDSRLLAEAHHQQGVIARETGRLTESETALQRAYDEATMREDLLLAAETAREQAELHLILGRNRETLKALGLSHQLFTQVHAQRELADVARRLRGLEHRFEHLVRHYAQNIESKDAYTLGHCERVADLACALAVECGVDPTMMFWFRVGALLHDVGKIVVPSDILNKAGPLSPEERAIMERHPVAGVELLHDVDFPWDVIPMIRGHHERWDGHGYPDALAGDMIPLPARILCIADVYDALTSHRPYRRAFEVRDALRLMQADSGRHFDPEILTRFFRIAPQLAASKPVFSDETQSVLSAPLPRLTQPRALPS